MPDGDYWDFINTVRRNWGSNFTIPGPFGFQWNVDGTQSAEYYANWLNKRGLKWVISEQEDFTPAEITQYGMPYGCPFAEGTAIPLATSWCNGTDDWAEKSPR